MFNIYGTKNEWAVGGKKLVAPMNLQALDRKLTLRGSLSDGRAFGPSKFIR